MKYRFRGLTEFGTWIESNKLSQAEHSAMLVGNNGTDTIWTPVRAETVGRIYTVSPPNGELKVAHGDVVKMSFSDKSGTYSRYYQVIDDVGLQFVELWRDYDMDPNTFEVTRRRNLCRQGEIKYINQILGNSTIQLTLLGNVWQNPELVK